MNRISLRNVQRFFREMVAIVIHCNAQYFGQFPRAAGPLLDRHVISAKFRHQVNAFDRFDCTNQNRPRGIFRSADDIDQCMGMHLIGINKARFSEHDFCSFRAPIAEAVGSAIFCSHRGFGFDNPSRNKAFRQFVDQNLAKQLAGQLQSGSMIEISSKWCKHKIPSYRYYTEWAAVTAWISGSISSILLSLKASTMALPTIKPSTSSRSKSTWLLFEIPKPA